jgi:nucleotide-binding universal stress UspA family protein
VNASLLVPLDGSEAAEHAIPYAIALARAGHLPVRLFHVFTPDSGAAPAGNSGGHPRAHCVDADERVDRVHDYLDRIAEEVRKRITTTVSTALVFDVPAAGICQAADQTGSGLMIMTRHARHGFAHSWLRSVVDTVIRTSKMPVLVVPARTGKPDLDNPPAIRRVLLPIDGAELSDDLLPIARTIGAAAGVHFALFWVGRGGLGSAPASAQDPGDNSRTTAYLLEQAGAFVPGTVEIVIWRSPTETVAETIAREASEMAADIIGLSTHAHRSIGRALLGSVADEVLNSAAKPILVYRPRRSASGHRRTGSAWEQPEHPRMALL